LLGSTAGSRSVGAKAIDIAFRLPKEKLEARGEDVEEIVRETVRNPTIARMQLEMDDLSASPDPP
jgi:hypothetical protein